MARAGRRRQAGEREPNGRLKRPTTKAALDAMAQAARRREQAVVLDQPHRREHQDDPRAESPLGRLCLSRRLRRELYEAGASYASIAACWRGAKGVPMPTDRGEGSATAEGPSDAAVERWERQMLDIEGAVVRRGAAMLRRAGLPRPAERDGCDRARRWDALARRRGQSALRALRALALDEAEVGTADEPLAVAALQAAAVELGLMREHPEAFPG